jgi:hypothetical protein
VRYEQAETFDEAIEVVEKKKKKRGGSSATNYAIHGESNSFLD